METVKLTDLMGTRYIIDDFARKLTLTLNKQKEKGDVIVDLSRCKFGPESAAVINSNMGVIRFINSTDAELDELCKKNYEIATSEREVYPDLEVPKTFGGTTLKDWVNSTPTGKYTIKLDLSNYAQELATVLFIMARPDCKLDLTLCARDIFNIIKNHVDFSHVEDVLYLEPPYCSKRKYTDVMFTPNLYIPYDFGTKQLVSFKENIKVPKEYMDVITYCADNIYKKFNKVEKDGYHTDILDLLKFRGEEEYE